MSPIHVSRKSKEEKHKGWRPDISDGVKINIAPWERLRMFPVKKIVGKVEMGSRTRQPFLDVGAIEGFLWKNSVGE